MNQTQTRSLRKKVLSLILAVVMVVSLLPISAFASGDSKASTTAATSDGYEYNIMFLDCGRKYYSVDNIKKIIDNASAAGFNYIQLAVGNDGLRFLLDDMSLTVNGTTYDSGKVTDAIHAGNVAYNKTFDGYVGGRYYPYSTDVNELTQSEMDTIIAYAATKGMGVIPCVNTPGHMDAILDAAEELTGKTCSYNGSVRTIDVTNTTAVAFTQALLQKYIDYFAGKGCKLFNMGADEYANDKYTGGSMGFGNLQSTGEYSYYVQYVNAVAKMIENAKMTPMAFNDGIYFNNNTSSGTFDTNIIICYWSNGWPGYTPMSESALVKEGFKLINTNGSYYWVLGKTDAQCDAAKASNFNKTAFPSGTVDNPVGSMFCIWADYPGAETEASVISKTAATIAAFGKALPEVKKVETVESKTVTKDNVTVTAPGLTDLTVVAADAPAIDAAAEGKVVAYDVTPATASGSYEKNGTVTLPIPEGWDASRVRGFVQNEDGSITTVTGTPADGKFTFTVPHFSVLGVYELAANAATETKTINLTVGGTTKDTIDGEYPGMKLDDAVASVVGGEPTDKPGTPTYEPATLGKGTFYVSTTANDTAPTEQLTFEDARNGQYYIKNSAGEYVYPDASLGSSLRWTYSRGSGKETVNVTKSGNKIVISKEIKTSFLGFSLSTTAYLTLNGTEYSASDSAKDLYLYKQKTTPGGKETTLTFTGRSVGTTTVTIGNVKYTIIVSDKAPDDALTATSIDLEYWITNELVHETNDKTTENVQKITTSKDGVTSAEGIAIADVAPETAYAFYDGTVIVHYWQAVRLDADHQQTDKSGVDQTAAGTTLTHIRYHGGAWQYKTTDGAWHYFQSDDQLVAYYLKETEVTKEVKTSVKDWGYGTNGTTPDTSSSKGQVALTVAVVYPDGTVSPAEGDMYKNSTTIFNYWVGRDIGIVAPTNNSDYNISKITVTDGKRAKNTDKNVWYTSDTITWSKKTLAAGTQWYDETEVWNKSSGTAPMVNGKNSEITWSDKNTAKLVLIYLESIVKDSNLNVVYQDDNTNTEISRYQIVMSYNQGQDQPTFDTSLKNSSGVVIGTTKNWPGKESSEPGYLPDDAYVTNSSQKDQKIDKNLATITGISGIYASGLYEYVGADISEDGKTLTLHYNLKNTSNKTFVMDFGLPLQIPTSEFGITNFESTVETVSFDQDKVTHEWDGKYGHGSIDVDRGIVTYTLTKALDHKIPIPVYVTFKNDKNVHVYNVYVIPATSVYYEDSFATFTNADGTKNVAQVDNAGKGIWTKVTDGSTQTNVNQALEELGGTTNTKNVYGYDPAYADSSKFSMGSATKVTVAADTYKEGETQWPTATFTFKGTGFDVISLTDNTSGAIFVDVYKGTATSGDSVKSYAVNNYYSYKQNENGQWVVSKDGNNALYQIPVMKVSGLDYGEYTAVIRVAYSSFFDQTTKNEYNFWLDAIRVYDPMGKDNATYEQDNEGYPQYIKLHDELVKTGSSIDAKLGTTVFIDGAAEATIDQYKNGGPNNEVYLANGQAITFKIPANANIASIQIGAKAPNGTAKMTVTGTDDPKEISSATEMYYKVNVDATAADKVVTIANKGTGILSLTNLKITFKTNPNATVTLAALSDEDQANAVAQVRALFAAPAEPFNPDRFDASWSRNVRKGETAKLTVKTSEDVEAITVNGETIDSFTERHERTGWGWWAKTVTYREFIYTTTADVTRDYTVCAVNAAGVRSEEKTATLTVRPSVRDWLHGIFGKWF